MKYYVRHKFSVLQDYNTFAQHPWHGAGQGVADAALHYIVLSDTLIDAYHSKIALPCLHDLTKLISIIHSCKAFINDVVLHAEDGPLCPFNALALKVQEQLHWWDQLVKVMGSALNPQKTVQLYIHGTQTKMESFKLLLHHHSLPQSHLQRTMLQH